MTKSIFIEGIQGSGKSTLHNTVHRLYPELIFCREGDYSPVELAWCTWMTEKEFARVLEQYAPLREELLQKTVKEGNHYIVPYTQILTDIPEFHKDLEQYEIYQGRKPLEEFEKIILARFQNFFQKTSETEKGYLFECSFFQNIIEDFILYFQCSDEKILVFYKKLFDAVVPENFRLLYLYSNDIKANIMQIKKERSDTNGAELWYPLMLDYLKESPYGKAHGHEGFSDMIAHFEHRQQLELRICKEILKDNAVILPAKEWTEALLKDIS